MIGSPPNFIGSAYGAAEWARQAKILAVAGSLPARLQGPLAVYACMFAALAADAAAGERTDVARLAEFRLLAGALGILPGDVTRPSIPFAAGPRVGLMNRPSGEADHGPFN